MLRRLWPAAPALPVLLFLPFLAHRQLGFDEIATYDATTRHAAALWAMLLHHTDGALGAWYWLERPLGPVADTAAWLLRVPALLAAAGTAVVVGAIGTELGGRRLGLLSSLALLANPAFWEFADTARPYTLALLTSAVCLLVVVRSRRVAGLAACVVYGVAAAATAYLQAMFVLFLVAQGVAILLLPELRPSRTRLLAALTGAAVATVPLAVVASSQTGQTSWIPYTSPSSVFAQGATFFGGDAGLTVAAAGVWLVLVAAALVGRAEWARVLVALGVLPPLVLAALGLALHVLNAGYFLYAVVPLSVAVGAGAVVVLDRRPRLAAPVLAGLLLVAAGGYAVQATRDYRQEDLRGAADYVAAHAGPGDGVLFAPDWTRVPLSYYLDKSGAKLADLAQAPVRDVRDVPDLYLPERAETEVRQAAQQRQRVWVLGYPGDIWRPTPNPGGDVSAALPRSGYRVQDRRMFGIVGVMLLERAS